VYGTAVRGAETPFVTITPVAPAAEVTPSSLSFPSQSLSTVSLPQTVTVKNTGNAPLTISGLTFTGGAANDFFVGSSSCGGSVAPGNSCQLTVRFAPSATRSRAASLTIISDDPGSPAALPLTGTGAQPSTASVSPSGGQASGTPGSSVSQVPAVSNTRFGPIELMSCRVATVRVHSSHAQVTRRVSRCSMRKLGSNARFVVTGTLTFGLLTQRGKVYATGVSGHGLLVLHEMRPIARGTYTLTLDYGDHRTTTRVAVS
jgi:hypothetical protein